MWKHFLQQLLILTSPPLKRSKTMQHKLLMNVALAFTTNISRPKNHRFHEDNLELSPNSKKDSKYKLVRDESTLKELRENRSITDENSKEDDEFVNPWNLSNKSDRIQFRVEGHDGPETYIFGFDTGHGKNRQFRLEERHRDGTVKGQYGYYDAKGKLRTVRYIAKPFEGYTERHHETNSRKLND
ncbi:uncharacterized protein LOC143178871 [Calliopsis andreniformis]|uniref:uncharacterized protein LOC143178871 n=1 Tax=Calliopsis andreniformis TaxID=337506 RepID=UPI003FCD9A0E